MEAHHPFEIKENIIGVYWNFDDAENDETISDNEEAEINHLNDGLYIYEIKNDEIQEIKMIKKDPYHYHSFIYLKDSIIIDYFEGFKRKVFTLDKNNLQIINNLTFIDDNSLFWNISSFNSSYFVVAIWKEDKPIKFQIYEIKTLKKVYEWETVKIYFSNDNNGYIWDYSLFKINNNDYLLKNLIIKIEINK